MEGKKFAEARILGRKTGHPNGMMASYDVPAEATHILVRPISRHGEVKIFVVFCQVNGSKADYKPKGNTGKYFYRQNNASRCTVGVFYRPSGWHYDIRWVAGE